ncbi:hypothetical protein GGS24DRAFT_207312 [Hypoxylon argillaceum]|nr:hypothetical protein GGS24DRAFT_207312 [Hypoxylon argillaceum]
MHPTVVHTNGNDPATSSPETNNVNSANGVNGHGPQFLPIAICGMACRLPGKVNSPADLWEFIMAKGDARVPVPETRYTGYNAPVKKPGAVASEYGYFLDESVDLGALDTSFFSIAKSEAERLDPQQRILLEVSRECIDDSGETGWRGKDVGVYVGSFGNDWYDVTQKESQRYGVYTVGTTHDFATANRVSYEMDLRGPTMSLRSACSSSLVCLNEACAAIAKGDATSAIVAGTSLLMAPALTADISESGTLSPDGSCKTFSSTANGYARAEGVVAIYVKPLKDAIRDGNPIRAVVVGTATNGDGKTPGMSMPSSAAQETLIRRTYELAGISEADIARTGFFECHGTGTPVGDPIETEAIARIFGKSGGVHIGSVKPNLGHGEGASGLTALLKAVMALEHRTIPPNIKNLPASKKIPFEAGQLKVPTEALEWPAGRDERVSVNSFGVGGANAHVILESAASWKVSPYSSNGVAAKAPEGPQILLFSANDPQSHKSLVEQYKEYLTNIPDGVSQQDIAYTLATGREQLPVRGFSIATSDGMGAAVTPTTGPKAPAVVMVFTGQGAQWPQMGKELLQSNATFKRTIRSLDAYLQDLGTSSPDWTIEEELLKPVRTSRVNDAEFSQPLCTALQLALVDSFTAIGVKPAAVVGHSSGEIAAAYAAGGLTAKDAIVAAFFRGVASKAQTKAGSMAAVGLGRKEAQKYLVPGVVVACDNSPSSVTLSGDTPELHDVLSHIKEDHPTIQTSVLKITKAYHSHHMTEVGDSYYLAMKEAGITGQTATIPFFSSLTGGLLTPETSSYGLFGPRYWRMNLESPVLFNDAVSSMLQDSEFSLQNLLFLELGPHAALAGPLRQIVQTQKGTALLHVPTVTRRQNSAEGFLSAAGHLWAQKCQVDFKALMPDGKLVPGLPVYPWNHQRRYWWESRVSKEWRLREHNYHDLLGARVPETSSFQPVWRNIMHIENAPWLRDHKVRKDIVFPFAGYISIAAEAIRQISGVQDGCDLRNVNVSTALVLHEEAPTEVVTTLGRLRLTDTQDSQWWEFSIASHNGHGWTKHCFGEVRASTATSLKSTPIPEEELTHKVSVKNWYERGRRSGSGYGYHFEAVDEVSTNVGGPMGKAMGKGRNNWHGDEANYHVHPIIVDAYLQLLSGAVHRGMRYNLMQLIPATLASISLSRCPPNADDVTIYATSVRKDDGYIGAGSAIVGGKTVVSVSGVAVFPLAQNVDSNQDGQIPLAARIEWVPQVDLKHLGQLVQPAQDLTKYLGKLETLGNLAIAISQRSLSHTNGVNGSGTQHENIEKYRSWLEKQATPALRDVGLPELSSRMDRLVKELAGTPAAPGANAIALVCENIKSITSGTKNPMAVLTTNDAFDHLKSLLASYNADELIQLLGHSRPNLHVLELAVGQGPSNTAGILAQLERADGQSICSKYVYANTLSTFVTSAKEKFTGASNIDFTVFDISKDPAEQDFADQSFDLIIAADVIHLAPDLNKALSHARKLLKPGGHLVMQQPKEGLAWIKYVLGILPSWWCGAEDGRVDEPYVSRGRWEKELSAVGFQGLGGVLPESSTQPHLGSFMVAQPRLEAVPAKTVTLLCGSVKSPSVAQLTKALKSEGYEVNTCSIADTPPAGQDVISLLDVESPFFHNLNSTSFEQLKKFLIGLDQSAGIFWVTHPSQTHCPDPRYGQVIGFSRTMRSELSIDFATCESDDLKSPAGFQSVASVFTQFHERDSDSIPGPNFEYDIKDGTVRVSRFFPFSLEKELEASQSSEEAILTIGQPGRLDTFHWSTQPAATVQGKDVLIEVHSAGLNFRDVLVAAGIIPLPSDEMLFGYEAAGIVRQVGPEVTKVAVGDRVITMDNGTFTTALVTSELICEKIPDSMSFADAASMPIVFATAIYALVDIAVLQKGQTILIHSACGGVGLAAIQLAQAIGAEIYTTVSNEEKINYLMETFNLPRHRIFHSRDESFVADVMRETGGKGVDVVLNSLSGDLLHATWRCVATWGTMVEIGKRDLLGAGKLDMDMFLLNRNYRCVAIDRMKDDRPELAQSLLKRMMEYVRQGVMRPVRLAGVFSGAKAPEAFKYMQKGTHIGKVIISLRDSNGRLDLGKVSTVSKLSASFNKDSSYLLIGGLGGLGMSVAIWMIQHGARNLIFLSRSAGKKPADKDFVRLLESMDCTVQLVAGSVSKLDDVLKAVDCARKPLKGIIQMSMVLRDEGFPRMTMDDWNTASEPKIKGTWNLHEATIARKTELDFLLLFSSLSGILGQPGQANYAAANTFLDSFVLYRNSMGLPCTAIDIGAIQGAGYLFESEELMKKMQGIGWRPVEEDELLYSLTAGVVKRPVTVEAPSSTSIIVGKNNLLLGMSPTTPLSSPDSSARLRKDLRMAVYHNVGGTAASASSGDNDQLRAFLNNAQTNPAVFRDPSTAPTLALEIGKKLFTLLLKPDQQPDITMSLSEVGLDSMVAVEMRAWWKLTFGLDITVLDMLAMGTLEALGKRLTEEMAAVNGF